LPYKRNKKRKSVILSSLLTTGGKKYFTKSMSIFSFILYLLL